MRLPGAKGAFPITGEALPVPTPVGEAAVYRKTGTVVAAQLQEDVIVETPEGPMRAKKGDYLCQAPDGHAWPVMRQYFEENNERVEPSALTRAEIEGRESFFPVRSAAMRRNGGVE